MILDGHIHIDSARNNGVNPEPKTLLADMKTVGVDGGLIISQKPDGRNNDGRLFSPTERLENLMGWTKGYDTLFPFFWIDPTQCDAAEQVDMAVQAGVDGFKVICGDFYPGDDRAMRTYQKIADHGKPILFHSGILWDGQVSAKHNRPGEFECLLDIEGLTFTLAHVSWPWYDECIAVFGKFMNTYAQRPDFSVEMFIDVTPGTPVIYREEVLKKLSCVEYDFSNHIIFGTDCCVYKYNTKWTGEWIARDRSLYDQFGVSDDVMDNIFSENLLRFLGKSKQAIPRVIPYSGE